MRVCQEMLLLTFPFTFLPFDCRYPDSWYQDITSNKKFFSLAATFRGGIVGMIVAEIKGRTKVHKEVPFSGLVAQWLAENRLLGKCIVWCCRWSR